MKYEMREKILQYHLNLGKTKFLLFSFIFIFTAKEPLEIDILQCCILDHIIYKITKHEIAKVGKPVCNG